MEDAVPLKGFPAYLVTRDGRIINQKRNTTVAQCLNTTGVPFVKIYDEDGVQISKGVARLVAEHFLRPHKWESFDTPINLDGNRFNNHADNLLWRPRWFAVSYIQSFVKFEGQYNNTPLFELQTGNIFNHAWDAATTFGLLVNDLFDAASRREEIWPTRQRFALIT